MHCREPKPFSVISSNGRDGFIHSSSTNDRPNKTKVLSLILHVIYKFHSTDVRSDFYSLYEELWITRWIESLFLLNSYFKWFVQLSHVQKQHDHTNVAPFSVQKARPIDESVLIWGKYSPNMKKILEKENQ